jgi:hypothetical protein
MDENQNTEQVESPPAVGETQKLRIENELLRSLASEGVSDLESALAVAVQRIADTPDAKPGDVVGQLKRDKAYLFAKPALMVPKTSGEKYSYASAGGSAAIENAAKTARLSGSIKAVAEYMRLRRKNSI